MLSNKSNDRKYIQCPYDPSHVIMDYRMQIHLVKCKENFPNQKMVDCMYNSVHRVPEPELGYHHEHCPDRIRLDKFVYVPETVNTNKFPIPKLELTAEENWDDECCETYNPEEYCSNNPILRNKNLLSAAKRRNFRMEERQRMQQFVEESPCTSKDHVNPEGVQDQQPEGNARRPTGRSAGLNNNDVSSVAKLMEQVKLGAQTATVPKLVGAPNNAKSTAVNVNTSTSKVVKNANKNEADEDANNDYPALGGNSGNRTNFKPPLGTWTASSLASEWNGVTGSNKPNVWSRGRGSTLAQQKK